MLFRPFPNLNLNPSPKAKVVRLKGLEALITGALKKGLGRRNVYSGTYRVLPSEYRDKTRLVLVLVKGSE